MTKDDLYKIIEESNEGHKLSPIEIKNIIDRIWARLMDEVFEEAQ
jgi:hypothetical protein